ncbi:MAG TPA: aspartyl protease family protein [Gammaproteobacteria bacterium]
MQLRQLAPTLFTLLAPALAMAAGPEPAGHIPLKPYFAYFFTANATVGGQTGTFMFDTGEGVTIMTPAFAQKVGCKPWGQATGFRLDGQRLDGPHCDGLMVEMPGVKAQAPIIGVFDVAGFMGPDAPPIDGIVGLDVFAGHAITLVPGKEIIVETPASLAARKAHAKELPVRGR